MSAEYGAAVNVWVSIVRRAQLDRDTKLIALLLATYADPDGTRIYPGTPRLAVQSGLSYRTVQRCMARLRAVQLIETMSRRGRRRGWSACYQLIIGPEVADRLDVASPAAEDLAAERVAERERERVRRHRGKHRRTAPQPVDNPPADATMKRHHEGVTSPDETPEPGRACNANPNSLTCDDDPLTLPVPSPGFNPPPDDADQSLQRAGTARAGDGDETPDDETPDTATRQGTEQARQAAADALREWERQHPEAVAAP